MKTLKKLNPLYKSETGSCTYATFERETGLFPETV